MTMKKITVLGSTGSVGVSTLDVIRLHRDQFQVFALTANTQVEVLFNQIIEFKPIFVVMVDVAAAKRLHDLLKAHDLSVTVLSGVEALNEVAAHEDVDVVMAAIVGAAGLKPCLAAVQSGKKLLLANKETLVLGGHLFMDAVKQHHAALIPIDSEHSAVFQSLPENPKEWPISVKKIILTASGGPFRTRDVATFHNITPEQACAHPNWNMGRKISVDSATMMNKALEVIEARFLFGLAPKQIEVVIHPQSIIHSMVEYVDASVVAQLGSTDMKIPIAYGLSWPQRIRSGVASLDFSRLSALTFEKPDADRFPGLFLSWTALCLPNGATGVLNAANEVAVEAFLNRRIRFDQIHHINADTLASFDFFDIHAVDDLIELDASARRYASEWVSKFAV